jgi:hypothetical protein
MPQGYKNKVPCILTAPTSLEMLKYRVGVEKVRDLISFLPVMAAAAEFLLSPPLVITLKMAGTGILPSPYGFDAGEEAKSAAL